MTDLNGDHTPDIAAVSAVVDQPGALSVFWADGLGNLGSGSSLPIPAFPAAMASVDLDRDLKNDLVIVGRMPVTGKGAGNVLLADKMGGFSSDSFSEVASLQAVATLDADEDGVPDLVYGSQTANQQSFVTVQLGDGAGRFRSRVDHQACAPALTIGVGDVNGDGHADLVIGCPNGLYLSRLLGDGRGGFAQTPGIPIGIGLTGLVVADLNGNSMADIAVVTANNEIAIYEWNEDPGRANLRIAGIPVDSPGAMAGGDFDGDAWMDLALVNQKTATVSIWFNRLKP